jgi:hypothetical protein
MFNQKKYYNYIKIKEDLTSVIYVITDIIFMILGIFIGKKYTQIGETVGLILGAIMGIIIYYPKYTKEMIKIEEMKMKFDTYVNIEKIEKNTREKL